MKRSLSEEIAKAMAINYYNLGVSSENKEAFDKDVFNKPFQENTEFSRNIFIIGSGCSKHALPSLPIAWNMVRGIEKELTLYERLGILAPSEECQENNKFSLKKGEISKSVELARNHYAIQASLISNQLIQPEKLASWFDYGGLEERLQVLLRLYTTNDVSLEVRKQINQKYFPNLFYEGIAHFMKHRFVDVIIDTNFDELLLNSIEDEMGSGDYHKIITKDDISPHAELLNNNRLRLPIYIKPHGTIGQHKTLQFTNEHYINQSPEMRSLIKSVITGNLSEIRTVETININVVGHRLEDDIRESLKESIIDNLEQNKERQLKINLYYWMHEPNQEKKQEFIENLKSIFYTAAEDTKSKSENDIKLDSNTSEIALDEFNTKIFICEVEGNISDELSGIFSLALNHFKEPYRPRGMDRHEFICKPLKLKYIDYNDKITNPDIQQLILDKALLHLIYDCFKFKCIIPEAELFKGRSAKYRRITDKLGISDGKSVLDTILESIGQPIYESFSKTRIQAEQPVKAAVNAIKQNILPFENKEPLCSEVLNKLEEILRRSLFSKSEPLELEHKKVFDTVDLFKNRNSLNYIYNNLGLSFSFIQIIKSVQSKDKLLLISRAARGIVNLDNPDYCNDENNYLSYLGENLSNIKILIRENRTTPSEQKTVDFLKNTFKNKVEIKMNQTPHQMLILIRNDEPIMALYYYLPQTRNRISPVVFKNMSNHDTSNMITLIKLFEKEFNSSQPLNNQRKNKNHS